MKVTLIDTTAFNLLLSLSFIYFLKKFLISTSSHLNELHYFCITCRTLKAKNGYDLMDFNALYKYI